MHLNAIKRDVFESNSLHNYADHGRYRYKELSDSGERFYYFLHEEPKEWEAAKSVCRSEGASLLIIKSEAKLSFSRIFQKRLWLGLLKRNDEWVWSKGDKTSEGVAFKHWGSGQPGLDSEECAVTSTQWSSVSCAELQQYLCE